MCVCVCVIGNDHEWIKLRYFSENWKTDWCNIYNKIEKSGKSDLKFGCVVKLVLIVLDFKDMVFSSLVKMF